MSDWSQLHQLTTKDVNFPKVPICRHVPQHSSYSIWYLCSWEDQERENEQGNEKSILEQLQQTLLGKMVKFSWSLVSLLYLPATFSLSTRFFVLKLKRWAKSS